MAKTITIQQESSLTPLSLKGTYLYYGDWRTSPTDQGMMETFDMNAEGTDAQIIGAVNDLDEIADSVFNYWDDPLKSIDPWWLNVNANTESAKRSLIRSLSIMPAGEQYFSPLLGKGAMFYELQIERMPWWENSGSTTVYTNPEIDCLGGKWTPSLNYGTLPTRITGLEILPKTGMSTDQSTVWVGILPNYGGISYTNFVPKVEAESGTPLNSATEPTGQSDASNGSCNTSATLTGSFVEYLRISLYQHAGIYADLYRGRYQLLARMKYTGTGVAAVRSKWGCVDTTGRTLFPNQTVYVSGNSYKMYEMGEVSFPSFGGRYGSDLDDDGWFVEAKNVSGTAGELSIDCFILMPCKHMVKVTNCHIVDSTNDWEVVISSLENDAEVVCANYKNGKYISRGFVQAAQWEIPIRAGVFVVCTQNNSGDAPLAEQIILNMNYRPRWMNYRE